MSATQVDPLHNIPALLIGTAEFFFSEGAETPAEAKLAGFQFFGNLTEVTPQVELKRESHIGSYRGSRRRDKTVGTEQGLGYKIKADEMSAENIRLMCAGGVADPFTQSAIATLTAGSAIAFTTNAPGVKGKHYDIHNAAGDRVRHLTNVILVSGSSMAFTAEESDNKLTLNTHGLVNGDKVLVKDIGASVGLTANTEYYVVSAAANTIELSTTVGGSSVNITTDGTVTIYSTLTEGTDWLADKTLGAFRLLTAVTATVTPMIVAPAIAEGDDNYYLGIEPLKTITREGIGKMVYYDQDDDNRVVMIHEDFACEVTVDAASAVNGTSFSDVTFDVSVRNARGTIFVRQANESAALTE